MRVATLRRARAPPAFHVSIGQDHDTRCPISTSTSHIAPSPGSQASPIAFNVHNTANGARRRESPDRRRPSDAARFPFDQRELRALRLPLGPEPFLEHPLAIEGAAARGPRLIDPAALRRACNADTIRRWLVRAPRRATTLQHKLQVPHSRPGTTRAARRRDAASPRPCRITDTPARALAIRRAKQPPRGRRRLQTAATKRKFRTARRRPSSAAHYGRSRAACSSRLAISGPAADIARCSAIGAARIAADAVAHLVHPALAFALLADRGAQRGLDRTPVLQLLAGEAQRGAQPRDLALGHDDVLRRSRRRSKSHVPKPTVVPSSRARRAPANTAFFMQALQSGFAMMAGDRQQTRPQQEENADEMCSPGRVHIMINDVT